uniref:Si:ch73-74h11.1 n=1 Tax=Sinocyclocheilus anshuiensis TaxID=1608454 RepID=A0A671PDU9_9TELE
MFIFKSFLKRFKKHIKEPLILINVLKHFIPLKTEKVLNKVHQDNGLLSTHMPSVETEFMIKQIRVLTVLLMMQNANLLTVNVHYRGRTTVAQNIRSDKDINWQMVEYGLSGHGADKAPYNLFVINPENGYVRVTGLLDREKTSLYNMSCLTGIARFRNGSIAEENIELKIKVEDQNDNPPIFKLQRGSVRESSKIGNPVMRIVATDADEPDTINSKIAYSLLRQTPAESGHMFSIDKTTGIVYVQEKTLDRERHDTYTLIVLGVDMNGAPSGNTGTGMVQIHILDINDNVPTLEKEEYSGGVDEGVIDVVVMRIKALDKDLEFTDNWLAVFDIHKGNEDNLFTIETDPKTNEGILKLVKPADFEKVKELDLSLVISNVAPFINGSALELDVNLDKVLEGAGAGIGAWAGVGAGLGAGLGVGLGLGPDKKPTGKGYPVKISVNNQPDGPSFSPSLKDFPVSEDSDNEDFPIVLGTFAALDGDTGEPAENVRYTKGHDPDNWLTIDEETAEIKLAKAPDRESKFLVNGTYFAKIICMNQDVPAKTVTGTIALKVEDSNDHCPTLTSTYHQTCDNNKVVNVTAFDEDADPNGAPYQFVLIEEESVGQWEMVPINGTTVSFHALEALWPGMYKLIVKVSDAQGLACPDSQKFEVEVCTCEKKGSCGPKVAAQHGFPFKIGTPAFGFSLSGAVLLLCKLFVLVPFLLIFCQCGTVREFTDLPFDAKESLIAYHTEGIGEDKEINDGFTETDSKGFRDRRNTLSTANQRSSALYSTSLTFEEQDIYEDMAVRDAFLSEYFSQKVSCLAANPPLTDGLLLYEYEGQGTPAGSVGRCSLLESDNDLEFLNNLGSKFLTLAELCHPPKPSLPPPKTEQVVKSDETSFKTEIQQSSVTKVETVNKSATLPSAKASQTLFVQQQPLFYLVEQHIPNTVFVESPTQGLYVINGKPGTEGLILQGGNVSQASLSRGQQAMYVINGAPVADIQPIQLQTAGQEQEAAMGCSPVSSPIGSPGGVLLMPMQFHENAMQGVTGTPPILLADVPTLSKQKKKKIPSETLGTKGVDPKVKDTAASK